MKKKIKDLTFVEIVRICEKYKDEDGDGCPLYDCCFCTPPYCWIGDDSRAETEVEIPSMTHAKALETLCRHLYIYEELRVRDCSLLDEEYFKARDMIVPEYKSKLSELQDWWMKGETE